MPRYPTSQVEQTEQAVLKFFREYRQKHHTSPYIRVVAQKCGLAGRSSVYKVLNRLIAKGKMLRVEENCTYVPV